MNRCIVLALDPGATSGAAIVGLSAPDKFSRLPAERLGAYLVKSATVRSAADRAGMVASARDAATEYGLPLVVLAEKWAGSFKRRRGTTQTVAGLGASWGRWAEALDLAKVPRRRVARVWSATWRARVIGGSFRTTEQWNAAVRAKVAVLFGIDLGDERDDEGEAICVGVYGLHSPEVAKILNPPKRARKAS